MSSESYLDKTGLEYFWTKLKSYVAGLLSAKADDSAVVHTSGAETVGGAKTFSTTISGSIDGSSKSLSIMSSLGSDYEMDVADFGDEKCCVYSVSSFKANTTSAPRLNLGDYTLLKLYRGASAYAKFLCVSPREPRVYAGNFDAGVWQGWDELCCSGGNFRFSAGTTIARQTDDGGTFFAGGTDPATSASIVVYGGSRSDDNSGKFVIRSSTATAMHQLVGRPDGALVWDNADITGDVHTTGNETIGGTKTFTSTISGDIDGNAATAAKLATSRTISLTGDVTGSVSFDGSANASITATVADDSHNHVISNVDGLQDALNAKAVDSDVVHLAGNETIGGSKTFSSSIYISKSNEAMLHAISTGNSDSSLDWELDFGIGATKRGGLYDRTRAVWMLFREPSTGATDINVYSNDLSASRKLSMAADGTLYWNGFIHVGAGLYVESLGVRKRLDTSVLHLAGGSSFTASAGARMELHGVSESNYPGQFILYTGRVNGTFKSLVAKPDGTLTWDGQPIQTSSDERLKTPPAPVPDDVLDAWEAAGWEQFKFLDAVERKGGNARLHLGLIAQRVQAAFEARGLDACEYGILCLDGEEGFWTVRYAEALAMEAACQRRENARLKKRVADLEERLAALELRIS